MNQEDLGVESTHIHQQNWTEGVGHLFTLQDSSVLPNLPLGCIFLFSCLGLFLMQLLCLLMSFLFCTFFSMFGLASWVVSKMLCAGMLANNLQRSHTIANLYCTCLRWVAIISVLPPNLKHQEQNDFSPTLENMLEHLKASPECSPWRPIMALVIPSSYSW